MNELSLLLVEDNILNQKLIFLNLVKQGFKIDVANNGLEAVEKFRERKYNLILMDLMMPVMDGLEATKHIRHIESISGGHTPLDLQPIRMTLIGKSVWQAEWMNL